MALSLLIQSLLCGIGYHERPGCVLPLGAKSSTFWDIREIFQGWILPPERDCGSAQAACLQFAGACPEKLNFWSHTVKRSHSF
jgi:hypothetical protein